MPSEQMRTASPGASSRSNMWTSVCSRAPSTLVSTWRIGWCASSAASVPPDCRTIVAAHVSSSVTCVKASAVST